jgi:hypothetical protein
MAVRSSRRQFLVGAAVLATASGTYAATQAKSATFVLIHAAWHGGWCLRRIAGNETPHLVVSKNCARGDVDSARDSIAAVRRRSRGVAPRRPAEGHRVPCAKRTAC